MKKRKLFLALLASTFLFTLFVYFFLFSGQKTSKNTFDFVNNKLLATFLDNKDLLESALNSYQKEKEIKINIAKVENFFQNYKASIKGYGDIIVRKAYECGGDYKILVGIAGNESGLGRIPYKKYNPYGFLNGVEYSSWEEALSTLSCEISKKFIAPCNADLYCIIKRYGGPETDQEHWIRSVSWFISQVK